ncbi:transposase [Chloroflexus sp.]|uniref:RNA-guided endonuclease InsQ/TnpB family protein n=1 Tax=Chloroflexus sp. TaxID=1904827 RepID=UPI002ADE894F|nr:transposase [Chloroflexus sp.]
MIVKHGDGGKLRFDDASRALVDVQNVGEITINFHRPLPAGAAITHGVINRRSRTWYVCVQVEFAAPQPAPRARNPVGRAVGLLHLLTRSNGTQIDTLRWLREVLAALRVAQRRLCRRVTGKYRYRTTAQDVACLHDHISKQRRDGWHTTTRWLVATDGLVASETLTLDVMTHHPRRSLSAHDAALGLFRELLTDTAESAGTVVVAVNPQSTSQVCAGGGEMVQTSLSERIHDCPHGHVRLDRDEHAARNILARALACESVRTGPSGANVAGYSVRSLRSSPL